MRYLFSYHLFFSLSFGYSNKTGVSLTPLPVWTLLAERNFRHYLEEIYMYTIIKSSSNERLKWASRKCEDIWLDTRGWNRPPAGIKGQGQLEKVKPQSAASEVYVQSFRCALRLVHAFIPRSLDQIPVRFLLLLLLFCWLPLSWLLSVSDLYSLQSTVL